MLSAPPAPLIRSNTTKTAAVAVDQPSILPATPGRAAAPRARAFFFFALAVILLAGALLRFYPSSGCKTLGFDEGMYRSYVGMLVRFGPATYPDMVEAYPLAQRDAPEAMLPPTRALFLLAAWTWHALFGGGELHALRMISALFSTLTLLVAARLGWRLGGKGGALAGTALLACAPVHIHLAQRALIDGFFTFWAMLALLTLWEALQAPPAATRARGGWLALYGVALGALVLTKQENAVFLLATLLALLALNRWTGFGHADRLLWTVTFVAPALGGAVLVVLCGGLDRLWEAYRMNVQKSLVLPYAIQTGDGPWHRYLLDLFTVNPAVLLLAVGGLWQALRPAAKTVGANSPCAAAVVWLDRRGALYLAGFVVVSYALMCQLRYGMNLRYAAIWDLPLCLFAAGQLAALVEVFRKHQGLIFSIGVALLCTMELTQYRRLFMTGAIYDPIPALLLRALDILKV